MSRFLLRRGLHTTWFGHFCYQTCRLGTIILWIQGRFFHGFLLGWASISPVPLFDAVPTSYGFNLHFEFPSFHVQILPFFTITSSQLVESPTFLWWIRRFLWISHQVKSPFCLWHPHFWLLKSHEDFPLTLAKLQFWLNSQASYVKSWFLRQSRIFATKSSPSEITLVSVKSSMFAMFECHFTRHFFIQVSLTDYDLDVEHFAGVLTYDPPHDTSVAPWEIFRPGEPLGFPVADHEDRRSKKHRWNWWISRRKWWDSRKFWAKCGGVRFMRMLATFSHGDWSVKKLCGISNKRHFINNGDTEASTTGI